MSRLTLRLPETLHEQLAKLAEKEGVSLNQYIVYSLTRQIGASYSIQVATESEVSQQEVALNQWIQSSEKCSDAEAAEILAERDFAEKEIRLDPEMVTRFRQMIQKKS